MRVELTLSASARPCAPSSPILKLSSVDGKIGFEAAVGLSKAQNEGRGACDESAVKSDSILEENNEREPQSHPSEVVNGGRRSR